LDCKNFSEKELETFYKNIGSNVRKIRNEKGVTQMQLALAINHNSVGHVAKAELYKYGKHFNLEQLYKISKVLHVDIAQFLKNS
jgi:transcriptional regulator with XRE-family HTH domain